MAMQAANLAYDFSIADTQPVKMAKPRKKQIYSMLTPKVLSVFIMVVLIVCLMVYNQALLTEVVGEINEVNHELKILQSENVRMRSELESTTSLRMVAEQAQRELGLHRLDKYQTEYVCLYQSDKIELTDSSPKAGVSEQAKIAASTALNRIKEYIGVK